MENPEEVLQALEEFQKMRPTEIPRELDEYIHFVAKTGDSVYQWPLVKPLFREKLVRVMTDFYENCPSLELASSPNIEQFNYDIMKCNLLELLESFANAPFTIQRLCELLTSPRKEYNRVDKFMRAIEKNILVVSTREPGTTGRRSENGDSMVNGSIDIDTTLSQQSHEVEIKTWDKNCTPTTDTNVGNTTIPSTELNSDIADTTTIPTTPSSTTTIPTTTTTTTTMPSTLDKELNENCQNVHQEKDDMKTTDNADNFMPTNHELLSTSGILTSSLPSIIPDALICSNNGENLTTNIAEVTGIAGEVTDAIVNEDTSSQPISDADHDIENESNDKQKLQTTFHPDDFTERISDDKVILNNLLDDNDENKKSSIIVETTEKIITKINTEEKIASFDNETKLITDNSVDEQSRLAMNELSNKADENECFIKSNCSVITTVTTQNESETETEACDNQEKIADTTDQVLKLESLISETATDKEQSNSTTIENTSEYSSSEPSETSTDQLSGPQDEKPIDDSSVDSSRPIIEEPTVETNEKVEQNKNTVIEEAMDDDRIVNSIVPDPIPIVEEPKDEISSPTPEPIVEGSVDNITIVEESSTTESIKEQQDQPTPIDTETSESTYNKVLEASIADLQETTNIEVVEKIQPAESMDVDSEDSMSAVQQDEPMDEECTFQSRS